MTNKNVKTNYVLFLVVEKNHKIKAKKIILIILCKGIKIKEINNNTNISYHQIFNNNLMKLIKIKVNNSNNNNNK